MKSYCCGAVVPQRTPGSARQCPPRQSPTTGSPFGLDEGHRARAKNQKKPRRIQKVPRRSRINRRARDQPAAKYLLAPPESPAGPARPCVTHTPPIQARPGAFESPGWHWLKHMRAKRNRARLRSQMGVDRLGAPPGSALCSWVLLPTPVGTPLSHAAGPARAPTKAESARFVCHTHDYRHSVAAQPALGLVEHRFAPSASTQTQEWAGWSSPRSFVHRMRGF